MKQNPVNTEVKFSKIGFGTAEIGFAYGIGPRVCPSDTEAVYLLKLAVDLGVTYFDAARAYQLSEERIGKSGIAKINGIIVGTKCAQFLERGELLSFEEKRKMIIGEVEASLKNLRLEQLPLLYLHGGTRQDIEGAQVLEILQNLKDAGKIKSTGISLRGEDNALAAVECGFFDVIQVAHSILDQRMAAQVLPFARKKIVVVNRSVFLKGALTPLREYLPDKLSPLKDGAKKANAIALELGINLPELAIRFAISNEAITTALVGTNKAVHLSNLLEAVRKGPLSEDILIELRKLAIADPDQIDPKQWPPI